MSRPSDWALAKAADHLFGDNFPSGAEVHIDRLAILLDAVKAETISEVVKRRVLVHHLTPEEAAGIDVVDEKATADLHRELEAFLLAEAASKTDGWKDAKDEWSAAIDAAHPMRSGSHSEYATAMRMIGNRHSKGELVDLVNWLLLLVKNREERARG
jgi:hypothetical protein